MTKFGKLTTNYQLLFFGPFGKLKEDDTAAHPVIFDCLTMRI